VNHRNLAGRNRVDVGAALNQQLRGLRLAEEVCQVQRVKPSALCAVASPESFADPARSCATLPNAAASKASSSPAVAGCHTGLPLDFGPGTRYVRDTEARYPSGKGEVCKTFMRGFDSHPRLQSQPTTSEW
jgi:hypothetical protein